MARLLVVHHSPTRSMGALTEAVLAGTRDDDLAGTGLEVVTRPALEASAGDVLAADALVLGTPANFGYMSGALKHFFDTTFLDVGGALADDGSAAAGAGGRLPFGVYVHGRYDVTGAVRAVLAITGALPWRQSAAVVEVLGEVDEEARAAAYELGGTLAALATG
jgi:multimeric flavodoxin WrbA